VALPGIPPWTDQDIELYHGTLQVHVASLVIAVDVTRGASLKDFGRGFYTTTNRAKALQWANTFVARWSGQAAVLRFRVSRNDLANLETLAFVRGDQNAIDYWSFVQYCRTGGQEHNRLQTLWYDVVIGPVTGTWDRQTVIPDADQISFHTRNAEAVLNNSAKVQIL
jgi:hypothetical protein